MSVEEEFLNEVVKDKIKPNRKKSINSKKKGSNNERECKDILNKRFEGVAVFSRTPMSGAYVGGTNREKKDYLTEAQKEMMTSDIFCNSSKFKFSIEHKAYAAEKATLWEMFNDSSDLHSWMNQVRTDSASINKQPLLIVKYNNHKRIAFVNYDYLKSFTNIDPVFIHNGMACFWFEDLLKLDNKFFFEE